MKKLLALMIVALVLAAMLLAAIPLVGTTAALANEADTLAGLVTNVAEDAVLLDTASFGPVLVRVDEHTVLLGLEEGFEEGMYVVVTYDGRMTRSMPAQLTAQRIAMFRYQGEIVEVLTEDSVLLTLHGDAGQLIVHRGEVATPMMPGAPVTVYTNGMMARSFPGQVTALHVDTPTLSGEVTAVEADHFLLAREGDEVILVHVDETTMLDAPLAPGDRVTVCFSGAMTFSLPAQAFALAVVHGAQ